MLDDLTRTIQQNGLSISIPDALGILEKQIPNFLAPNQPPNLPIFHPPATTVFVPTPPPVSTQPESTIPAFTTAFPQPAPVLTASTTREYTRPVFPHPVPTLLGSVSTSPVSTTASTHPAFSHPVFSHPASAGPVRTHPTSSNSEVQQPTVNDLLIANKMSFVPKVLERRKERYLLKIFLL